MYKSCKASSCIHLGAYSIFYSNAIRLNSPLFLPIRKTELSRRARRRSSSQTNPNQLESIERREIYATHRRSVSNSNLKSPQSGRKASNLNRSLARATPNVNGEQSRKQVTENSQKVMDILQMDKAFFARINLANGLKSMTAKQFIDIVAHFSMKISGKNMITAQNGSNGKQKTTPEVEILSFLQMLNYPYVINKSCLKTPNAQHMFKECVGLLAWLSDIVRYSQKDKLAELPMDGGNEFPNESYTKHFSLEVQNAFHLWNEESEEASFNIHDGLIETFVKAKRGCASIEQMIQKADELQKANEKLSQALAAAGQIKEDENAFEAIQSKYNELEQEFQELKIHNAGRIETINRLNDVLKLKAIEAKEKKEHFNAFIDKIGKQKYTTADIQRISENTLLTKQAIALANQEIARIRENGIDHQIKVARLKQRRNATIPDLNALAFNIAQILAKSHDYQCSVNVNDLCFDISANTDTLHIVCMRFERLHDNVAAHKQRICHQIDQHKAKLSDLQTQSDHLKSELKNLKIKFQKANRSLATINQKIFQYETESKMLFAELQPGTLNNEYEKLAKEMADKREMITNLEIENLKILEDGENCIYKIIEMKHNALEILDNMSKLVDDFKSKN